jgi:hypothetical protein
MDNHVKVLVLKNEVEAHLMEQALTDHNIPHLIRSYHDSAYDGLFQAQKGWGHIDAPAEFKDEINAIYREMTSPPGPTAGDESGQT